MSQNIEPSFTELTEVTSKTFAKIKISKEKVFLFLHFFICFFGLIKILHYFATKLYSSFNIESRVTNLNEWLNYGSFTKLPVLLQYGLSLVFFAIFYGLYAQLVHSQKNSPQVINLLKNRNSVILYFLTLIIINISLILDHHISVFFLICWVMMFSYLPSSYVPSLGRRYAAWFHSRLIERIINLKYICVVASLVVIVQFVLVFVPLIFKPIQISNDYFNIPEKTILESGQAVDNIDYINQHHIGGLHLYDPRKDAGNLNISDLKKFPLPEADSDSKLAKEEKKFIGLNSTELSNQAKVEWFFYHHNYVLGPMIAMNMGVPSQNLTLLYGWLSTYTFMKILNWAGGLNFQTYFKLLFSFYPLYFWLFFAGLLLIFKRIEYALLGVVGLSISIYCIGYEILLLAPGFNPIRHLFDIFVWVLLFQYFQSGKKALLGSALLVALFAVLWSKDFGLFLLASVVGILGLKTLVSKKLSFYSVFSIMALAVLGITFYALPLHGKNPSMLYMLLGVCIPNTSAALLMTTLVILGLIYVAYIHWIKLDTPMACLSVSLFFYSQMALIYYIWYPMAHHLLNLASPLILLGLTWIYLAAEKLVSSEKRQTVLIYLLLLCVPGYLLAMGDFNSNKKSQERIFKSHVVHHWQFKQAKIKTTMEPEVFQNSIDLIHKYAPQNKIYLISKYDHLLLILANRYNGLPFTDLPLNLFSAKEINLVINLIKKDSPEYIFMDTDIDRSYAGDIFDPKDTRIPGSDFENSKGRALVFTTMNKVGKLIKVDYQPVEKGKLITVYKRAHELALS